MSETEKTAQPVEFKVIKGRKRAKKPTTVSERIAHFEDMLVRAQADKVILTERIKQIDNFLLRTNNALIALKLYRRGITPNDAFRLRQEGKNPEDILKEKKR